LREGSGGKGGRRSIRAAQTMAMFCVSGRMRWTVLASMRTDGSFFSVAITTPFFAARGKWARARRRSCGLAQRAENFTPPPSARGVGGAAGSGADL